MESYGAMAAKSHFERSPAEVECNKTCPNDLYPALSLATRQRRQKTAGVTHEDE